MPVAPTFSARKALSGAEGSPPKWHAVPTNNQQHLPQHAFLRVGPSEVSRPPPQKRREPIFSPPQQRKCEADAGSSSTTIHTHYAKSVERALLNTSSPDSRSSPRRPVSSSNVAVDQPKQQSFEQRQAVDTTASVARSPNRQQQQLQQQSSVQPSQPSEATAPAFNVNAAIRGQILGCGRGIGSITTRPLRPSSMLQKKNAAPGLARPNTSQGISQGGAFSTSPGHLGHPDHPPSQSPAMSMHLQATLSPEGTSSSCIIAAAAVAVAVKRRVRVSTPKGRVRVSTPKERKRDSEEVKKQKLQAWHDNKRREEVTTKLVRAAAAARAAAEESREKEERTNKRRVYSCPYSTANGRMPPVIDRQSPLYRPAWLKIGKGGGQGTKLQVGGSSRPSSATAPKVSTPTKKLMSAVEDDPELPVAPHVEEQVYVPRDLLVVQIALAPQDQSLSGSAATEEKDLCFRTINAAIQAARPGDRINVLPGVYLESVVIDKPVSVIGMDSSVGMGGDISPFGLLGHAISQDKQRALVDTAQKAYDEGFDKGSEGMSVVKQRQDANEERDADILAKLRRRVAAADPDCRGGMVEERGRVVIVAVEGKPALHVKMPFEDCTSSLRPSLDSLSRDSKSKPSICHCATLANISLRQPGTSGVCVHIEGGRGSGSGSEQKKEDEQGGGRGEGNHYPRSSSQHHGAAPFKLQNCDISSRGKSAVYVVNSPSLIECNRVHDCASTGIYVHCVEEESESESAEERGCRFAAEDDEGVTAAAPRPLDPASSCCTIVQNNEVWYTKLSAIEIRGQCSAVIAHNVVHHSRGGIYIHSHPSHPAAASASDDHDLSESQAVSARSVLEGNDVFSIELPSVEIFRSSPLVKDNTLAEGASCGILIHGQGARPDVTKNMVAHHQLSGIEAREGSAPIIQLNHVADNARYGLHVHLGAEARISGNTTTSNGKGDCRDWRINGADT